jgi:PAS domain S-box-containing protein
MLLRNIPSIAMFSIFLTNTLLLAGQMFLYTGIMRFLDKDANRKTLAGAMAVFILLTFSVIYLNRNDSARVLILYLCTGVISLACARALFLHKCRTIAISANFLLGILLFHGAFFVFRFAAGLTHFPVVSVFTPTLLQTATFIFALAASVLTSFGLIIMASQQSKAQLREATDRYQSIFDTNPEAILITTPKDGRFFEINRGFSELTGYSLAELSGKSILDFNIWENPAEREKFVATLQEGKNCENLETVVRRKDGSLASAILTARFITISGKKYILGVVRNISDRKKMEETLRKSEEKFRLMVENSHDILYTISAQGIFSFVSPTWTTLLGHQPAEVIGKSFQDFVHPEDIPDCMIFLQSVNSSGKRQEGIEYRVCHIDGSWRWHTSSAVPFTDEKGNVAGFYGIASDITERKKKELAIRELIASLEESNSNVKTLKGFIPICANCKKVRDEDNNWEAVEEYITRHTAAKFSHGICPDCIRLLYPDLKINKKSS